MKGLIVTIFGQKAGMVYAIALERLFGIVVEGGGQMSVAAADVSIEQQMQAVDTLAQTVGYQLATTKEIGTAFEQLTKEAENLDAQIAKLMAQNPPNEALAMPLAISLNQINERLPGLASQLDAANKNHEQAKAQLQQANLKLTEMKSKQKINAITARANQALEKSSAMLTQSSTAHQRVFDNATEAIKRKGVVLNSVTDAQLGVGQVDRDLEALSAGSLLDKYRK